MPLRADIDSAAPMKRMIVLSLILSATVAAAFDSEAWFGKREMLTREAERLQAAYSNCLGRVDQPAEGVVVPVEMFPDGSIRLSVEARKAQFFLDTGFIWGEGVIIRRLDEQRRVVSRIDAGKCVIDRNTRSGWIEGRARVSHEDSVFEGENIYFSSPEGYLMSTRSTKLLSKNLKLGGVL